MENVLHLCEDGSHTLFSEKAGECYHSTHGAYTESMHIFIKLGLHAVIDRIKNEINLSCSTKGFFFKTGADIHIQPLAIIETEAEIKPVRILEIGFGTGLNALLTTHEAEKETFSVSYLGLEPFPVLSSTLQQLNYSTFLFENDENNFAIMHACDWNTNNQINSCFNFRKLQLGFMEAELEPAGFDLIYFDAFSPEAQPELWQPEVFVKCFDVLAKNGVLVTYCAKGAVKRALKSAGFMVENLPGPPGKREITRAHKLI